MTTGAAKKKEELQKAMRKVMTDLKPLRKGWNEADVAIYTPLKSDIGRSKKEENKRIDKTVQKKGVIPIFFTTDDNYLPFLSITLESLWENSSREYDYEMYVLHSGLREDYIQKILRYNERDGLKITFLDVTERASKIVEHFQMRDYYTPASYYRLFIPEMFPDYEKAFYFDCDTVIMGDVSELFEIDMGENIIAGIPCEGVNSFDVYKQYVSLHNGLNPDYFFNSGVMLMHLENFRKAGIFEQFVDLLKKYKFAVIQDEDYLNVLCQDRVMRLPRAWNKSPVALDVLPREDLRIVHYLMTWKPWHYTDVPYQEYFWEYAERTEFYDYLKSLLENFTVADMENDKLCEKRLKELAVREIAREDNYFKTYGKRYGNC